MAKNTDKSTNFDKDKIILYRSPDGKAVLDVRLEGETLWLNLNQMAMPEITQEWLDYAGEMQAER